MNLAKIIPAARQDFAAASMYLRHKSERTIEEIVASQLKQIARVWEDAVADVPYYAQLVSAGNAPDKIVTWADFAAIPILDRATIRENERQFIRASGPPDGFMQTAGSTGNPIRFGVQHSEGRPQRVVKQATWIECGYQLGADLVLIWGHSHLLGAGWRRWVNHAIRTAKDQLIGYHRANAYTLGAEECIGIARQIVRIRPVGIVGYAAALDLFGRHAARMRDELRGAGIRFLITTAELPPRSDTLEMLRDLFGGCAIVEEFGGVEFGQLGVRIDAREWQTFPDLNILEAIEPRDEPDGHSLIVTTLYPRYLPFVRYKQGDLVDKPRRLKNGHLVGFERLVGRAADMIEMPDGRSVHSVSFFHCIHQEPIVLNIQMIIADQGPRLKLVVSETVDSEFESRIRHRFKQIHPSLGSAPIEYAKDLATNVAGKRRWYIDQRTK